MATTQGVTADDVLDQAEQIVVDGGLGALSVRRIGKELGVSRQVVYTHFGGMHGLLAALHVRTARELAGHVDALPEPPGTLGNVVAAGRVYVAEARRRPHLFELAFGRPLPNYEPDEETLVVARATFDPILAVAGAWLVARDGESDPADVVAFARVLWSVAHGHITLELAGHAEPVLTDALVARALEAVATGWRSGTHATPPDQASR